MMLDSVDQCEVYYPQFLTMVVWNFQTSIELCNGFVYGFSSARSHPFFDFFQITFEKIQKSYHQIKLEKKELGADIICY